MLEMMSREEEDPEVQDRTTVADRVRSSMGVADRGSMGVADRVRSSMESSQYAMQLQQSHISSRSVRASESAEEVHCLRRKQPHSGSYPARASSNTTSNRTASQHELVSDSPQKRTPVVSPRRSKCSTTGQLCLQRKDHSLPRKEKIRPSTKRSQCPQQEGGSTANVRTSSVHDKQDEDGELPVTPRRKMFSRVTQVTGGSSGDSDQQTTLRVVPRLEAAAAAAAKKAAMAKDCEAREQAAIAAKKAELKKLMERNARTAQRMSSQHIHAKVVAEAAAVTSVTPTQKFFREPTLLTSRSNASSGTEEAAGYGSCKNLNRRTSPSPDARVPRSRTPPRRESSIPPVGKIGNVTPRSTSDIEMIQVEAQLRELETLRKKNEESTKRMLARARACGQDKVPMRTEVSTEHSVNTREMQLESHRLEMEMLRAKNARNVERMIAQRKMADKAENGVAEKSPLRRGASPGSAKQCMQKQVRQALVEVQPPEIAAD